MSRKKDSLASLQIGMPPLSEPSDKSSALHVHLLNQERLNSEHRIMLAASPVYRLLLVARGSVRMYRGGKCLQVEAGMAMLLPPDEFAELEPNRHEDEHLPVCFRFDFTAADLSEPKPIRPFGLLPGFPDGFAEASAQVFELAEELYSLRFARTASVRNRRQPLFARIMMLLAGNEESAPIPVDAARAIADSLSELEHRLAEDWTVARLAEAAGLPSRQYASVFRSITGLSPLEYLNELRIEHAGMMLLGNWFGREEESERWLEHYFEQEREMWNGLGHRVKRETASVFTFERNRLFVMGRVGLSALLYHPDGFLPAEPLLDPLRRGDGYVEIPPEKAIRYAADRVFLLLPPTAEERKSTGEFMRGPYWNQLQESALRGVHVIESAKWNFIDAYSRSRLLTDLPDLLGGRR